MPSIVLPISSAKLDDIITRCSRSKKGKFDQWKLFYVILQSNAQRKKLYDEKFNKKCETEEEIEILSKITKLLDKAYDENLDVTYRSLIVSALFSFMAREGYKVLYDAQYRLVVTYKIFDLYINPTYRFRLAQYLTDEAKEFMFALSGIRW
jgi:hypothetical protein